MRRAKPAFMWRAWWTLVVLTLGTMLASGAANSTLLSSTAQFLAAVMCLFGGWLSGHAAGVYQTRAAALARRHDQHPTDTTRTPPEAGNA